MKVIMFVLCFAIILQQSYCQTYWTDIFLYYKDYDIVKEGAFKQLFQMGDTNNRCYESFQNMRRQYNEMPKEMTDVPTAPKVLKEWLYFNSLMLEFYNECSFENLVITLGKRINSFSGFIDMVINVVFRYFQLIDNTAWQQEVISVIDEANYSGLDEDWEKVGIPIGMIFQQFWNFEIPAYDYTYDFKLI